MVVVYFFVVDWLFLEEVLVVFFWVIVVLENYLLFEFEVDEFVFKELFFIKDGIILSDGVIKLCLWCFVEFVINIDELLLGILLIVFVDDENDVCEENDGFCLFELGGRIWFEIKLLWFICLEGFFWYKVVWISLFEMRLLWVICLEGFFFRISLLFKLMLVIWCEVVRFLLIVCFGDESVVFVNWIVISLIIWLSYCKMNEFLFVE